MGIKKCVFTSGNLSFEIEGSTQKELFKGLAEAQEIFQHEPCGMCKSNNVKFAVRTIDSNDFFELKCNDCGAALSFGQHKSGSSLFPKRKEEDAKDPKTKQVVKGKNLPNKGWRKWEQRRED